MPLEQFEYEHLYQRIEKRFQKRTGCLKSWIIFFAVAFVSFSTLLAIVSIVGESNIDAELVVFSTLLLGIFGLWGVLLILRSIWVYIDTVLWVRAKEKAYQREIEMALWHKERRVPSFVQRSEAKRKNDKNYQSLRLSYDGELVSANELDTELLDNYLYGHE